MFVFVLEVFAAKGLPSPTSHLPLFPPSPIQSLALRKARSYSTNHFPQSNWIPPCLHSLGTAVTTCGGWLLVQEGQGPSAMAVTRLAPGIRREVSTRCGGSSGSGERATEISSDGEDGWLLEERGMELVCELVGCMKETSLEETSVRCGAELRLAFCLAWTS